MIETKAYPYSGKMLSSKKVYVENKLFSEDDAYGRKKYYGYRASDGQLIRYVTGAYPSFNLADQAAVFALTRSTTLNPDYTVKDAITDKNGRPETVVNERGTISSTVYDAAGRVIVSVRGTHSFQRRSGSPVRCGAEVSGGDFVAAILAIVAFAVGHLACLFDSMHHHMFRMSRSPAVRQHRGHGFTRQLIVQRHSEFTKLGPGEI